MRRVSDPNGVAWNVDVSWTDMHFGTKFKRKLDQHDDARRARAEAKARGRADGNRGSWLDFVDIPGDSPGAIIAGIVVVLLIILAVLAFPWLLVLFLDLAQLLVFPLLALVIIGWRVVRRRPFTITAERERQRVAEWRVVGLREARRVERAIAEAIIAGGDPAELFRDNSSRH